MVKKREHYRYELKDGRKIVYIGITSSPDRRETQHKKQRKRFSHMRVVGPRVTRKAAERWEESSLETYRKNHQGRNPRYNRTSR